MNHYLQTLWRAKTWLIVGAGIGAILAALIAAAIMSGDRNSRRTTSDQTTANAQTTVVEKPNSNFGETEIVEGTEYVILPLFATETNQEYTESSLSRTSESYIQKNHLFIDLENDRHHWLFFTHGQLITNYQQVYQEDDSATESDDQPEELVTVAILYNIVETDTNIDGELTPEDEFTIAVSKPNGREYAVIDTKVEQIIDQIRLEDELAIVYLKNNQPYLAKFDFDTFTIETDDLPPARL